MDSTTGGDANDEFARWLADASGDARHARELLDRLLGAAEWAALRAGGT